MEKTELLGQKEQLIPWYRSLESLPAALWLRPLREGGWTIAEVAAHLKAWDEFVMEHRLVYISRDADTPPAAVHVQDINDGASRYARSGISRVELLNQCIAARKQLVQALEALPEEKFRRVYQMGSSKVTLAQYVQYLIEHDVHHRQQITAFVESLENGEQDEG
ncbi:DinB family protein [Ectobacillus ponti]|uniref:DinB family protein n=1 Tax=Ectobacillus ponti TaxID=2961894 RepID=A0AA41X9L2_9BACI|nr:DinB family protein [Ectobacillus ponti]MCP8969214.1 DinB family protein [Ectobacillus ponti]